MATATIQLPTRGELVRPAPQASESDPLWYKDAIIYQLHVRAFRDSNGDGIGDFRGLTERLDYIQDLGVTAIWLLPFFPSPLRDDGYDIADYTNVNPQYGTLDDFRAFLDEAHRRDLRVITELVMNHTSDQHAWFQRARRSAPDSPWRDWYVWSDTPERYQEARIIFQDFESSNWSWDPVAGAYFWHRFYSHQPDLNFDNPDVRQAMFETLDYWFHMGVDGLRLDAVPYLFERDGTNCENLPETHAFLRDLREHIDATFADKMLLAEANQWPEDAAAYFGDGDECHMNFHFPLMPRLFMAVEREDRSPIVDILEQTPLLPHSCQWAIFLRNHDELTLEMVTDEERDYMVRTYAVDARARINLGIRRRLAPLMANNRRKIELMNALLLSLPGTPVIYYGDEIGMGDNYYLGDRNGVRTPMHWNADRNAGFSRANPQSLYLPVIIDPEYHYEMLNVEVQHSNPHSLLWWTRRILDLRKQYRAFGEGSFTAIPTSNPKVFAYLRETDQQSLLIVANLSRLSQYVELDLSSFRGRTPMELFGNTMFPTIGEAPYLLSLGPHGFFWFCLNCRDEEEYAPADAELPLCRLPDVSWKELLQGRGRKPLSDALEPFLKRRRWFAGKARRLQGVDILDAASVDEHDANAPRLLVVQARFAEGEPDCYVLPAVVVEQESADELLANHPESAILQLSGPDETNSFLCEATWEPRVWSMLLDVIAERKTLPASRGKIVGVLTSAMSQVIAGADLASTPAVHGGEQSNTSATFDGQFILKLFRRVTPGLNPDFEIGRELSERKLLSHVPQVAGAIEYRDETDRVITVGILHEFVPNVGDAWTYTLDELSRYYERIQAYTATRTVGAAPTAPDLYQPEAAEQPGALSSVAHQLPLPGPFWYLPPELPVEVQETIGGYLSSAELLGRRTAELHVALSQIKDVTAFAPDPFTKLYQRGLYQSMRNQARTTFELLRSHRRLLAEEAREPAERVLAAEPEIMSRFARLMQQRLEAERIRCHGDYHLGQVLFTGKDFVIIDFEGEPDRPVSERRIKASPLRDVAGMLRSFHYAAHAAIKGRSATLVLNHAGDPVERWASFWSMWSSAAFLHAYLEAAQGSSFLPPERRQIETILGAYVFEKALYELRYELNNRPDWVRIPLEGVLQLLE